jgi:hypothetical protein
MMLSAEEKRAAPGDVTMRTLAPTLCYDLPLAVEMNRRIDDFKAIPVDMLLLGGSLSPAYMRDALDTLENIIPRAIRVEFPRLGHGASGNVETGGKPELVAVELRRFFAET